ncbi:hypothetical protein, partial [Streptococcus pneumoniae]|uniref:hypothetical protein n=1 Tax=Streptococcus pneumoniae TaxID=1313 RepID=UPI001E514246
VLNFLPRLVDKDGNEYGENNPHPYEWVTKSPDRRSPLSAWATRLLKNSLVYDAGALYIERQAGKLHGLRYVDGSTLFLIVNQHGELPQPYD